MSTCGEKVSELKYRMIKLWDGGGMLVHQNGWNSEEISKVVQNMVKKMRRKDVWRTSKVGGEGRAWGCRSEKKYSTKLPNSEKISFI